MVVICERENCYWNHLKACMAQGIYLAINGELECLCFSDKPKPDWEYWIKQWAQDEAQER